MDLDALREALDNATIFDRRDNLQHETGRAFETSRTIKEAARAVLDSEEAWWCETHAKSGFCFEDGRILQLPREGRVLDGPRRDGSSQSGRNFTVTEGEMTVVDVLKAQQGPDCAPRPVFEDGGWFGECAGCEWVGPERVGQYDAVKDWERWHTPLVAEGSK